MTDTSQALCTSSSTTHTGVVISVVPPVVETTAVEVNSTLEDLDDNTVSDTDALMDSSNLEDATEENVPIQPFSEVKIEPKDSDYSADVAPDPVSTPSGSRLRSEKGKNVTSSPPAKIFTEGNNKLTPKQGREHSEEMDEPMTKKKPKTVCNNYVVYSYIVFCKVLIETHYFKFTCRIVSFLEYNQFYL